MNTLLTQIDEVNKQIATVEPNGYLPNDLYDTRDALIDQLSSLVDIKVSYNPSGGNALKLLKEPLTSILSVQMDNLLEQF